MATIVWSKLADGNFQMAANWKPSDRVPGENDNALITVAGEPYTVTSAQDILVGTIAISRDATLDITGGAFGLLRGGTNNNAGTVKVEAGAAFGLGSLSTLQQASSGKVVVSGAGATLDFGQASEIVGGQLSIDNGAFVSATFGSATLTSIAVANGATISVTNQGLLVLDGVIVSGDGAIKVDNKSFLRLTNGTVLQGNDIQVAGALEVDGHAVNETSVTLSNAKLVSRPNVAATFTNAGTITGSGAFIGDAGMTLVNTGTIVPVAGSLMQINAGTFTNNVGGQLLSDLGAVSAGHVDNFGTVEANGAGRIDVAGGLTNAGVVTVKNGGTLAVANGLTNAGTVTVESGGTFAVANGLTNAGAITVETGGAFLSHATQNQGTITASGAGTTMTLGNDANTVINSKSVAATAGAVVKFDAGVTQIGGLLKADSGGEVDVFGAAIAGAANLSGKSAVLDLEGSTTTLTTTTVVFATEATAQLVLNNSAKFAGVVIGFAKGDSIDVKDIAYAPGHNRYDDGFLTVSDGSKSASITLLGSYDRNDFAFTSDGHGGTLITVPDAPLISVIETSRPGPAVVAGTIEIDGMGNGVGSMGADVIDVFLGGVAHGGPGDTHLELDVVSFQEGLNPVLTQSIPADASTNMTGLGSDNWIRGGPGNDTIDGGGGDNIAAYSQPAQQYTVTTKGNIITVEDRSGHDGTDTLFNIQHLEFQGGTLDTMLLSKAATLPQQQFHDLAELYVGYFNRAPDALGLDYWASRMVDGMSLVQIAKSFFVQPETAATYPPGTTTEAFVTQVYQNALGRAPDKAGFDYWLNDLNSGNVTPDVLVLAFISGAKSATGGAADVQYLANKEAVGVHFALDKGLTDGAWGAQVMAHVDGTAQSVAAANQMTDDFANQVVMTDPHLLLPIVGVHSDALVSA